MNLCSKAVWGNYVVLFTIKTRKDSIKLYADRCHFLLVFHGKMVSEIAVRDKICTKNGSKIAMMHNVLNFEVDHVCNWILYQVSFTP